MQIDLHLMDRKYESLRVRNAKEESRLVAALADHGEVSPVVVVESKDSPGRYVVIDGHKRLRAAKRLRHDVVEATVWGHSEVDALVLMHNLQRPRERSALEDAYLLQALTSEHGLHQTEIARRLGRSQSWVSRRLGLVKELPAWLQESVRKGELQCHGAVRYFLPMARANPEDAERLARNIAGLGLSTRQIAELYRAWLEGSDQARELVVAQPQTALRVRGEATKLQALDDSNAGLLLQDIEKLASIGQRARRLLDRALLDGIERSMGERIVSAWTRAQTVAARLDTRLHKEVVRHDRPGDQKNDSEAEQAAVWNPEDCADGEGLAHQSKGDHSGQHG
jgi:ParB family transcriptional regulator, chromosome partitioning protein